MKKYITYKYRAYPNKAQQEQIDITIDMAHYTHNVMLNNNWQIYRGYARYVKACTEVGEKVEKKLYFKYNHLPSLKTFRNSNKDLKRADSIAIKNEFTYVSRSFISWFNGKTEKPKFKNRKSKDRYITECINNNIRQEKNKVRLPKVRHGKM